MKGSNNARLLEAIKNCRDVMTSLENQFDQRHLNAAKDWPDWFEYLTWALQNHANAKEMELFRKAQNGEALI